MTKNRYYNQCRLQKDNITQVSYIPTEFAHLNGVVSLKNEQGKWESGWIVRSLGPPLAGELVEDRAHNSKDIWKPSTKLTDRGNK